MDNAVSDIVSPEALFAGLEENADIAAKTSPLLEAINRILLQVGGQNDISNVRNIMGSLINQDEIFNRLYGMYEEVYAIWQRLRSVVSRSGLGEDEKKQIENRATQIVSETVFNLQREVFFKIVNAKEVAEGEKNEDGPALLYPAVEKVKIGILKNIRSQTEKLRPAAVDICKSFRGISEDYARTENIAPGEKLSYDTIAQVYEQEKALAQEIFADINAAKISDVEYLNSIIKRFKGLGKIYRLKSTSLKDKRDAGVTNFVQKIDILKAGFEDTVERLKPLSVLKQLVDRFPALEKQLDFFAESHYQAKAVMQFMEEVNEEMSQVFIEYTMESFSVISLLRYKLNGTSHMYESIYYYYAVVQIENDMKESLGRRYPEKASSENSYLAAKELRDTGIPEIVTDMHQIIAEMNDINYKIHKAFLRYKKLRDIEKLKNTLLGLTKKINSNLESVKSDYKKAQKVFLNFLSEDLGSTDVVSQFNLFLRNAQNSQEASRIRKSFNKLLATKKTDLDVLEKKLTQQFGTRLEAEKISAMAVLKVRQDFQKELLNEVQQCANAQDVFVQVLKEFIQIQDDDSATLANDNSIIWKVERTFPNELKQFKAKEANRFKKILRNPYLTERDFTVCFLASNITPQELASFSRLLPGLPRNEFQLDSPYGRFLLDIKTIFKERLQSKGASGEHITEKIYEKRERIKLVNEIALFLLSSAEPFLKKIDVEELKINHLISLQKRKYQKELNEVIKFWQYLVQQQISPGKGARGRFREYSLDEKQLMMKYISPEQLNIIERQLEASYDLSSDGQLFAIECFLMEIVKGLFQNFKEDMRIKASFENYEKGKKIKQAKYQQEENESILDSEGFVPNIKACMSKVITLTRRDTIARFISYWEYLIDQKVPASEKRKLKSTPKVELMNDSDNAVHYISIDQLLQIKTDLGLIRTIRDQEIRNQLNKEGQPVVKIAEQCFKVFKEGQKKLVLKDVDLKRQEDMQMLCSDGLFEQMIKEANPG